MKFTARINPEDLQRVRDLLSDDHRRVVVETGIKRAFERRIKRERIHLRHFGRYTEREMIAFRLFVLPRSVFSQFAKQRTGWFLVVAHIRLV